MKRQEPQKAIEALERAVATKPDDAEAQDMLGRAYLAAGKSDQALAAFDAASKASSQDPAMQTRVAISKLQAGQRDSAIIDLEREIPPDIPWILRGPPENIAKAKQNLAAAIEQAQNMNHTGYLVLPDPRTYRYVIGQGGSKVNSIRKQTGCKITVPRDQARDEAIEVCGSAEGVEKAKELILQAVKEGISNGSNGSRA